MIYYAFADKNDCDAKEYFSFGDYNFFYNSLIYNYIYYVFGIYFGSLIYVLQKGYSFNNCDAQKKNYLLGVTKLSKKIKKKSRLVFYFLGIAFLIIIIFFSFGQFFALKYNDLINNYEDNIDYSQRLKDYDNNIFITLFMLLDTDIVVLSVNFMALFWYLKGENAIYHFLHLNFWSIFNKIYFSFLLLINPVILYVFYITETRIQFSIFNCYLYSFSCGILLFTLVIFVYAFFELPFKKFIKLILKKYEVKVSEKRFDYMEYQNVILKQIDNAKGRLASSKSESYCEEDNDEENNNENEIKLKENLIDNKDDKDGNE
jgi:hypothetical protein